MPCNESISRPLDFDESISLLLSLPFSLYFSPCLSAFFLFPPLALSIFSNQKKEKRGRGEKIVEGIGSNTNLHVNPVWGFLIHTMFRILEIFLSHSFAFSSFTFLLFSLFFFFSKNERKKRGGEIDDGHHMTHSKWWWCTPASRLWFS